MYFLHGDLTTCEWCDELYSYISIIGIICYYYVWLGGNVLSGTDWQPNL